MVNLVEMVDFINEGRDRKLDYLELYLIESGSISINEAQDLIYLIEAEKKGTLEKVKAWFKKKMDALKAWFEKMKLKAKKKIFGSHTYSEDVKRNKFQAYVNKIRTVFNQRKDRLIRDYEEASKKAATAFERQKATVKAAYRAVPKGAKYGIGAAGAAGLGAYAYSKYKNK